MNSEQSPIESTTDRFEQENRKAEDLIASGDLPSAAAILVKLVEKDPQNARAFNSMGIISWMQQAWGDAFVMFKKSVTLKPDYADALMNLFDAGLRLHRVHEILPELKRAAGLLPGQEEIKVLIESIEEQGEEIYKSERALKIGIHNPIIEEGNRLLDEGKTNEAMAKYLEANDTQGPSADAFCGLGVVSYYQKRYKDAFTLFFEAIKLNPADPDTFLNLLDAAKNCNQVHEAKKIYGLYAKEIPSLQDIAVEFDKAV
ncbi:MAG: tetratricopeptide repeat protein [Chitinivibrionales bacterium]|nr:tetratricopeptide repeat protein [Chitinivibrionales bacterium]